MAQGRAPNTPSAHVREKRRRRRAEILHAALQAFRENGYHTTTLDDIAERLGVGKTALYHYFPDKESILYECHRESLGEIARMIEEAEACCERASEKLGYLIRACAGDDRDAGGRAAAVQPSGSASGTVRHGRGEEGCRAV